MKSGTTIVFGLVILAGIITCTTPETKNGTTGTNVSSTPAAVVVSNHNQVTNLAGRWRNENRNERGIWMFDNTGRCIIRSSGLVEQKGRYQYDGKELLIHFDSGSTRYRVIDRTEPRLVITMRWGDLYNLTNVLVRLP